MTDCLTAPAYCLIDWIIDWLNNWFINWLMDISHITHHACALRWTIYSESAYFCLKRWLNHEVLWDKRGKIFLWLKTTANHRLHLTSNDEKIPMDEKLMQNVLLPDWACFQFLLEMRINYTSLFFMRTSFFWPKPSKEIEIATNEKATMFQIWEWFHALISLQIRFS